MNWNKQRMAEIIERVLIQHPHLAPQKLAVHVAEELWDENFTQWSGIGGPTEKVNASA